MTLEARKRLTEAMRTMGDQFGLRRPVTWIQPGSGGCSDLYREAARECFGDRYGYVSAATYPNRALLNLFSAFRTSRTFVGRDNLRELLLLK